MITTPGETHVFVRVINKWVYSGKEFLPNTLLWIPSALFDHIYETSTVEPVDLLPAQKVFNALCHGFPISQEVKDKISLSENDEEWTFRLDPSIKSVLVTTYYRVRKDPNYQVIK